MAVPEGCQPTGIAGELGFLGVGMKGRTVMGFLSLG
jgi:hypothetical protein